MSRPIMQEKLAGINIIIDVATIIALCVLVKFTPNLLLVLIYIIYAYINYRKIEEHSFVFSIYFAKYIFNILISSLISLGIITLLGIQYLINPVIFLTLSISTLGIILSKIIYYIFIKITYLKRSKKTNVLIIGNSGKIERLVNIFSKNNTYSIIGIVDNVLKKGSSVCNVNVLGKINTIDEILNDNRVDIIVQISGIENTTTLMTLAENNRIRYIIEPSIIGTLNSPIEPLYFENFLFIEPRGTKLRGWSQVFKRFFDLTIACISVLIISPIFLILAIYIKLSDKSLPIFSNQQRIDGRNAKMFTMFKFRTLPKNIEEKKPSKGNYRKLSKRILRSDLENKISPMMLFIRRSHLADLPQLWNVVRGEMGIVGPRPPYKIEFEEYDWLDKKRLLIKPGMTGLWQINRTKFSFDELVKLDRYYVENWSFSLDLKILIKTILKIFQGKL